MNKSENTQTQGAVFALAAGILWGSMGVFVRFLNSGGLSSLEITQIRVTLGMAAVGLYLLLFHRELLRIRLRDLWCFLGTGIVSLMFFSLCYFRAMETLSLSTAAVLLYTAPIHVMLLSLLLFREKVTARKIAALVLALAGCALVSGLTSPGEINLRGVLLGLASGFFYALYSIFSRYCIQKGYHSWTIVFYTFLFCGLGCSFLCDWQAIGTALCGGGRSLIMIAGLGIITAFLPYVLYSMSLERLESSRASILASIEPVVGTIFGVFLFHEPLSLVSAAGIVLVLGAILVLSLPLRRRIR